ncbi:murein biosynthesis integral membrane protein MurJ [Cupriavidus sp. WS]|uniref:murein biosynthesis integral membrane protein MurJ n=1 Tax=Cupriavidus sp. WS TaxID=1312922 RepID=UPI0018CA631C|nr:lipid II flippase MurJ [Cupriavidus sp. WS]
MLLAALFGTSAATAALRVAQVATLVPVNFFTADSLSAGFLPLYGRYTARNDGYAQSLFLLVSIAMSAVSVMVALFLFAGAPLWISLIAPGFDEGTKAYAVLFVRVMSAGVPFYVVGGLFSYLEMANGEYRLASVRATVQSVGMILGTVLAFVRKEVVWLAWGFTLAYLFYAIWGAARVCRRDWISRPLSLTRVRAKDIGHEFWRVMKPLLLLPLLLQGNIVAERAVASLLGTDTVAALDYARFITDTGVLLLAVPVGLAGLATIGRMSDEQLNFTLNKIIPLLLLATVPLSIALAVNSKLLISLVYERGAFDSGSTKLTGVILVGCAAGFWAQVISYVLIKVMNARFRNREVFIFMAAGLLANTVINVGLYQLIGPVVLGLGNCAYGIVILACCCWRMKLADLFIRRAACFSVAAVVYVLLGRSVPTVGWQGLIAAVVLFFAYWIGVIVFIPILRRDLSLFIRHIRGAAA